MGAPAVALLAALLSVCSSIQVPGPVDVGASAGFDGAAAPADFVSGAGSDATELGAGEGDGLGGPAVLGDIDLSGAAMPAETMSGADGETRKLSAGEGGGAGDLSTPATDAEPPRHPWAPSAAGWQLAPSGGGQPLPPGPRTRPMTEGRAAQGADVGTAIAKLSRALQMSRQRGDELDQRIALLEKDDAPADQEGAAGAAADLPRAVEQWELDKLEDEHHRVSGIYNTVHKLLGSMLYSSSKLEGSVTSLYEGKDALAKHLERLSQMAEMA